MMDDGGPIRFAESTSPQSFPDVAHATPDPRAARHDRRLSLRASRRAELMAEADLRADRAIEAAKRAQSEIRPHPLMRLAEHWDAQQCRRKSKAGVNAESRATAKAASLPGHAGGTDSVPAAEIDSRPRSNRLRLSGADLFYTVVLSASMGLMLGAMLVKWVTAD